MSGIGVTRVAANDFAAQWDEVGRDALGAVDRVGRSGWLVLGSEVEAFEAAYAAWWGAEHAVGVASGLDALEIGLRCAGIAPGDRVLTTPLTAFATTLAVLRVGATPVFADVDASGSLDLDAADAALAVDNGIRAIVPVHLYGHPLDPARLGELATRHGVAVLEDCAQSAGAERAGAPTGLAGFAAATSLYPTKNLGAMGDAGILLTDDGDVAERARVLRNYGQRARYEHVEIGLNSRLDELQAAILRSALLPRLDGWLARRAAVAARYDDALGASKVLTPVGPSGGRSAHHLYPVLVDDADTAGRAEALRAAGVGVNHHYPALCVDQPACRSIGPEAAELPVARDLAARELSLPLHPYLDNAAVERVVDACLSLPA